MASAYQGDNGGFAGPDVVKAWKLYKELCDLDSFQEGFQTMKTRDATAFFHDGKAAFHLRPASLDAPIGDDDSTKFGEIVGDEDAQTPFELFRDKSMRAELRELLEVLDDREREIIFKRFALDGGKPQTLEEVGKQFGVTGERIRQLQNIAQAKLRRALAKREKPIVRRDCHAACN
jgi:hypothetical protein